jgi:hypothetical protein
MYSNLKNQRNQDERGHVEKNTEVGCNADVKAQCGETHIKCIVPDYSKQNIKYYKTKQ